MKYVYVLTSSEYDFYYEQFFLSLTSLRLYNPYAHITVLIDSKTKEGLTEKRSGYEHIISETITITAPQKFSQKEISRWIKTSIKNYVTGDFLYIDCDTIVTGVIDCNFPLSITVGAILDTHVPLLRHHLATHFEVEDKTLKFVSALRTGIRYNGGIIFCRDTPEGNDFFSRWHSLWLYSNQKGISQDMPALNQANHEMNGIIAQLPGEWNCQITHNGLPFLPNAKIIHYYATAFNFVDCPYLLGTRAVLTAVKKAGVIPSEIMELLKKPKNAFQLDSRIISEEAKLDVINSNLFSFLLRIKRKKPKLFDTINSSAAYLLSRFRS